VTITGYVTAPLTQSASWHAYVELITGKGVEVSHNADTSWWTVSGTGCPTVGTLLGYYPWS
jgi:hypothetical protein